MTTEPATRAAPGPTTGLGRERTARLAAYLRLGNLTFPTNFLGTALWWFLLPPHVAAEPTSKALLVVTLSAFLAIVASASAFDDLVGFREGIDGANYRGQDDHALRPLTAKPLLGGTLTDAEAERFAWGSLGVALVLFVASWWLAGFEPLWYAAYLLVWLALLQYSAGVKLSYIGAQELVLWAGPWGSVVFPYALATSSLSTEVVLAGALFGFWMVQVALFSNVQDREGDRAAGRRTWAVQLSPSRYRGLVVSLFALQWVVLALSVHVWSNAAYTAMACVVGAGQIVQLWKGCWRNQLLQARKHGFQLILIGVVGTCLASLV